MPEAIALPTDTWTSHEGPEAGNILAMLLLGFADIATHLLFSDAQGLITDFELPQISRGLHAARPALARLRRLPRGRIPLRKVPRASLHLWLVRRIYGMAGECETGHEPDFIDPKGEPTAAE